MIALAFVVSCIKQKLLGMVIPHQLFLLLELGAVVLHHVAVAVVDWRLDRGVRCREELFLVACGV